MPGKPNSRNWNDVQTAMAAVAIVTTLGLWNLFATPAKAEQVQTSDPTIPPTEPPAPAPLPTVLPKVKIMFTPLAPQSTVVQQTQSNKKRKSKNNNSASGGSVTQTRTS